MKRILMVPVEKGEIAKALNTSRLVRKEIDIHRNGQVFKQNRWVSPDEAPAAKRQAKPEAPKQPRAPAAEDVAQPRRPKQGEVVSFRAGQSNMQGRVIDNSHRQGVVVETQNG